MMIEERVATRSRGRLLNAGDGASALALGTDARGERCAYRVRRPSCNTSQASNGVEGTGLVARTFLPIHQI